MDEEAKTPALLGSLAAADRDFGMELYLRWADNVARDEALVLWGGMSLGERAEWYRRAQYFAGEIRGLQRSVASLTDRLRSEGAENERLREKLEDWGLEIVGLQKQLSDAPECLAQARAAGQREGLERAAKIADDLGGARLEEGRPTHATSRPNKEQALDSVIHAQHVRAASIAAAIRALAEGEK